MYFYYFLISTFKGRASTQRSGPKSTTVDKILSSNSAIHDSCADEFFFKQTVPSINNDAHRILCELLRGESEEFAMCRCDHDGMRTAEGELERFCARTSEGTRVVSTNMHAFFLE